MAKRIMKNINTILVIDDYSLVCDICNVIAKRDEVLANDALQFWCSHNANKVPGYLR
ncbi:MAG: hypothetical protein MJ007_07590 [Paludibacteraceae bacterium]|nr:hypothetical protein [Paludibacteraceae bacterium]